MKIRIQFYGIYDLTVAGPSLFSKMGRDKEPMTLFF